MFMTFGQPPGVHAFFEYLALSLGVALFRAIRRRSGPASLLAGPNFPVLLGGLLGAGLGNKALFWIENPQLFAEHGRSVAAWLSGQSMVGGLLGGLIGVEIAKKLAGIRYSTGDDFVYPILLGLMIGRIGCFWAGLPDGTHGLPTSLPWAVDFGDGLPRHPTQLYEIGFAGLLWRVLKRFERPLAATRGLRFKWLLCAYLLWRLLVDFIKPVPYAYAGGLSGIQWACVIGLALYLPLALRLTWALPASRARREP